MTHKRGGHKLPKKYSRSLWMTPNQQLGISKVLPSLTHKFALYLKLWGKTLKM